MASASHMYQSEDDVAGVQVGIPLPICNRNQGNIMTAESELIAAEYNRQRIELDLKERLAMVYRRYADARQQVERYQQKILPRAQKSIDLVGLGYSQQQVDFLTLLTSQRTYIRVNLDYIDSLAELRQSAVLIDGLLLSGSLQQQQ
jgi:cobalt-zinc-cadmium efflux system outer membrane protein